MHEVQFILSILCSFVLTLKFSFPSILLYLELLEDPQMRTVSFNMIFFFKIYSTMFHCKI